MIAAGLIVAFCIVLPLVFIFLIKLLNFLRRRLHLANDGDDWLDRLELLELDPVDRSSSVLIEINMFLYKQGDESKHYNQTNCVICLNNFEVGRLCIRLVNCKHMFHKDCMDRWILRSICCPLCRASCVKQERTNEPS